MGDVRFKIWCWRTSPRHEWAKTKERAWSWSANHVPRSLAYWCAIRVGVHATTGPYSGELVPGVTLDKLLKRWNEASDG